MMAPLLALEHVSRTFVRDGGSIVSAVRNVSLHVGPGETVALVGESGSGKSTLGRIALGLLKPDSGRALIAGEDISRLAPAELRRVRRKIQPVFQDPTASLNPRRTVADLIAQALPDGRKRDTAVELLERVGLRPGAQFMGRLPHEVSGGQRQRIAIARALAAEPALIIADEPLSGADVSVRGQVLNLLIDLQRERGLAYLMITHDISIARVFANRVAVMMRGEIVETGPAEAVLTAPQHDYTRRLVAAVPRLQGATGI
jgi:ABC-type glutathione transport system ATPase component